MLACLRSLSRETSLMAVHGAPSSCSSLISFRATRLSVSRDLPLYTVAYVPYNTTETSLHNGRRERCVKNSILYDQNFMSKIRFLIRKTKWPPPGCCLILTKDGAHDRYRCAKYTAEAARRIARIKKV